MQSDSSCGGEVISKPFTDWRETRRAMDVLERLACDVDAEPGLDSGFHVHASVEDLTRQQKYDAWFQFIRWERALKHLALGRFDVVRDFNFDAQQMFGRNLWGTNPLGNPNVLNTTPYPGTVEAAFRDFMECGDRHCAINPQGCGGRTFEFRLWNSTRIAWRMHMFAGLSRAFVYMPMVNRLAAVDVPEDVTDQAVIVRDAMKAVMPQSSVPGFIDQQLSYDGTDAPFTDANGPLDAVLAPVASVRAEVGDDDWVRVWVSAPEYVSMQA